MAKPKATTNPPEQLRVELARMRMDGLTFAYAWKIAMRRIVWPSNTAARREWKQVLVAMRPTWKRCYDGTGQPINVECVVLALVHESEIESAGDDADIADLMAA